ncbi:glutamyl-tRNA reductase [Arthrobacter sp. H41]|uniref:glutamyl-tRNA reductase n=1 Tax=Arthrobacter sp. H41 TaxID=1312978 RepID=UPI0004B15382|nr:glutamyl-tRNA reductase [Arthrobacter sp. H41]
MLRSAEPDTYQSEEGPVLLVLVAKYRELDLESAARLSNISSKIGRHLTASSSAVTGSVVLSTCNRFEIYCETGPAQDIDAACAAVREAVSHCSGLSRIQLTTLFELIDGPSVAEHLFTAATGLQSIVAGEREIAGQVRRALSDAQRAGTAGGRLIRLFEGASRAAKEVGTCTTLSATGRSIADVALDLATSGWDFPSVAGRSVILFGTGAYAGCVLDILRSRGCSEVLVFSRSGRAQAFVAARQGTALAPDDLPAAAARADLLIGCSGTGARISASELMPVDPKEHRPLTVIDLVPSRDFDSSVAELPGIDLITLESVRRAAPKADADTLHHAQTLVRRAAQRFAEQERTRIVDTAIVALRQHIHQVLDTEMDRVTQKQGCSASTEEVNAALRRIVRQLLHVPTVRARQLAVAGRQDEYVAALETLFGIRVGSGSDQESGHEGHPDLESVVTRGCGPVRGACNRAGTNASGVCPKLCNAPVPLSW